MVKSRNSQYFGAYTKVKYICLTNTKYNKHFVQVSFNLKISRAVEISFQAHLPSHKCQVYPKINFAFSKCDYYLNPRFFWHKKFTQCVNIYFKYSMALSIENYLAYKEFTTQSITLFGQKSHFHGEKGK